MSILEIIGKEKKYKVNIFEGSESSPSLIESDTWISSRPGDTNTIKIMKTPHTGFPEMELKIRDEVLVPDFWLGNLGTPDPEYCLNSIEIETLESGEIDKFNQETGEDVNANQARPGITEVLTHGEPEICYSP